jgi:hypothetical protein
MESKFASWYDSKTHSDVTIVISDASEQVLHTLHAHCLVLWASSEWFRNHAQFTGAATTRLDRILLHHEATDLEAVLQVVKYMYTGVLEEIVGDGRLGLMMILLWADYYLVEDLVVACQREIAHAPDQWCEEHIQALLALPLHLQSEDCLGSLVRGRWISGFQLTDIGMSKDQAREMLKMPYHVIRQLTTEVSAWVAGVDRENVAWMVLAWLNSEQGVRCSPDEAKALLLAAALQQCELDFVSAWLDVGRVGEQLKTVAWEALSTADKQRAIACAVFQTQPLYGLTRTSKPLHISYHVALQLPCQGNANYTYMNIKHGVTVELHVDYSMHVRGPSPRVRILADVCMLNASRRLLGTVCLAHHTRLGSRTVRFQPTGDGWWSLHLTPGMVSSGEIKPGHTINMDLVVKVDSYCGQVDDKCRSISSTST